MVCGGGVMWWSKKKELEATISKLKMELRTESDVRELLMGDLVDKDIEISALKEKVLCLSNGVEVKLNREPKQLEPLPPTEDERFLRQCEWDDTWAKIAKARRDWYEGYRIDKEGSTEYNVVKEKGQFISMGVLGDKKLDTFKSKKEAIAWLRGEFLFQVQQKRTISLDI
ncbi:MAG: hypothetical protein GY941_22280 [Planctomycetes bacterium]|nr:hypothetical protein [Planctomycetota bacterium]